MNYDQQCNQYKKKAKKNPNNFKSVEYKIRPRLYDVGNQRHCFRQQMFFYLGRGG